jgi:hypothetical protein
MNQAKGSHIVPDPLHWFGECLLMALDGPFEGRRPEDMPA